LKLAAQQKPPAKRGTCGAAATNTSKNSNKTASPRYADNEAQYRVEIWIMEHRLRVERMTTEWLTRTRNRKARNTFNGVPRIGFHCVATHFTPGLLLAAQRGAARETWPVLSGYESGCYRSAGPPAG